MKKLSPTELNTLIYLLERHIEGGSYFGVKARHYEMCNNLLNKLTKTIIRYESKPDKE
jgi:hypothetical protein